MKKIALGVAGVVGLALGLALLAPGTPLAAGQEPPTPQQPRQGGPEEGMMRRPFAGMMGGTGSMVALDKHLYILMGATLYKIDPEKMEIVKKLELVQPGDMRRSAGAPGTGPDTRRPPRQDQ